MNIPKIHHGLDNIYVDTTSISNIDGEKGTLSYRDIPIEELVKKDFTEVIWLVLFGKFPTLEEIKNLIYYFMIIQIFQNMSLA